MGGSVLIGLGAACIGLCLGLLGSGGSIITVPVLVYLVGQDEKIAIAGSLAIVGIIAFAASLNYMRQGQVDWRMVLLFGVPGMVGTFLGAWASALVTGIFQLAVFAVVMLLASWFMLRPVSTENPNTGKRSVFKIGGEGAVVGVVTGFVGVGGGFLIVPALVLLGGLTMHRAVATSLVIIAMKSLIGFIKYLDVLEQQQLSIDWSVVIMVSAIGVVGSVVGNTLAGRVPQALLKKIFAVFLIFMGLYILMRSLPALLG